MHRSLAFSIFAAALLPGVAVAQSVTPGNLLVSTEGRIYETTIAGQVLQDFPVEYPVPDAVGEIARDIVIEPDGTIHAFNGTFSPYLSSLDTTATVPAWTHRTFPDWRISANTSHGGIAFAGSQVFVIDNLGSSGVVVFDNDTGSAFRFADGTRSIDVTIGLDGLLYVLSPNTTPGGLYADVFDPQTYAFVRRIDLRSILGNNSHRAIAVDAAGDLFVAAWSGEIFHVSAAGQLIKTAIPVCDAGNSPRPCSFGDINVSPSGQLALGSRFGEIVLTDTEFSAFSAFKVGNRTTFVEFVPLPAGPTTVDIDILPGRSPNKLRILSKKNLWVSILTSVDFNALDVDPGTVQIGVNGATINRSPKSQDSDGDGDLDLEVRFEVKDIGIVCGDTELTLSGETYDGRSIVGTDSIITRGC